MWLPGWYQRQVEVWVVPAVAAVAAAVVAVVAAVRDAPRRWSISG